MRLYGEIIRSFSKGIIDRTGTQTMLYLTSTMISSVDLAHYAVRHAKDWVSVDCDTITYNALGRIDSLACYICVTYELGR